MTDYDLIKNCLAFKYARYPYECGTYGNDNLIFAYPNGLSYVKNLNLNNDLDNIIKHLKYATSMRDKYPYFCATHNEWRCIVGILIIRKQNIISKYRGNQVLPSVIL